MLNIPNSINNTFCDINFENHNLNDNYIHNNLALSDLEYNIKKEISSIKNNIELKYNDIKQEILSMKNELKKIKSLIIQPFPKDAKIEPIFENEYNIKENKISFNSGVNLKKNIRKINYKNALNEKNSLFENLINKVTLSMNDKDLLINISKCTIFQEFKTIALQSFNFNPKDNIDIYYFNFFGIKKFISNQNEFNKALSKNVFKYYIIKHNSSLISVPSSNNISFSSKRKEKNFPNKKYKTPDKKIKYKKEINDIIEEQKRNVSEVMTHFASLAFLQNEIPKEDYINSVVYVSDLMNKINIKEQKKHPNKFYNPKQILQKPWLLTKESQIEKDKKETKKDQNFILSMISQILREKGINASIYKENQSKNELDGASLQYLFGGLTEKKKYKLHLNLDKKDNNKFIEKEDELKELIDNLRIKFSEKLKIKEDDILLVNPNYNKGQSTLDLIPEDNSIFKTINKLKEYKEIKEIEEKPLIEGCQLNSDLFDPAGNNQDGGWGIGETRGKEEYKPPLGWIGYGLKVKGKYDNGNDTWLDFIDIKDGVFAVAYFGISNIYGNKKNLYNFLHEIASKDVLKIGYEQTYKNDQDLRNPSQKCGSGIYLFQDPQIAENTAGIINIGAVRYKLLLMCRVNPKKIRQPKGFKDCWILNSSPFEIRPYRILIKKIFLSAMAGASQNEIKTFTSTPSYIKDIMKLKDTSFYNTKEKYLHFFNKTINMSNDKYVIFLYTTSFYREINDYLREGKLILHNTFNEQQIKSWVYCLHKALNKKVSNVSNGTICYRGVSRKFPDNLGVGSKFILAEFTSTSENKEIALIYAGKQTLFKIRIENNNSPNCYCYKIDKISQFKVEEEILITSNCIYQVTKKAIKNDGITKVNMTCKGYNDDEEQSSLNTKNKFIIKSNYYDNIDSDNESNSNCNSYNYSFKNNIISNE